MAMAADAPARHASIHMTSGPEDQRDERGAAQVDAVTLPVRAALLHRPAPPKSAVFRERLNSVLEQGLRYPVSLACAPAGFGKTVLISQFCDRAHRPAAWLSLDSSVNELRRFLLHLTAAVRGAAPGTLVNTSAMASTAGELPSHQSLVAALSNDLDGLPEPIIIVLDDYHHITTPSIHQVLSDLIRHPSPSVHLMIITREEPPLSIGRLRAQGRLSEVRVADLAFSQDELQQFMQNELPEVLTTQQLGQLYASTEGWPAGVRLAAQAIRLGGGTNLGAGFLDLAAQEYLLADVLERVPDEVRQHLGSVALFDQFSAGLCDAIQSPRAHHHEISGSEFIAWLRQHDLFIVQLDAAGEWFRFHHLFARLLRHWRAASSLDDDTENEIRHIAARFFREHGHLEEAIEQLDLLGAHKELAAIAAEHGTQLVEEERWAELGLLTSVIPSDVLDGDPHLLLLSAWNLGEIRSRYSEMNIILDRAEALLDEPGRIDTRQDRWARGQIANLRGGYDKLPRSNLDGAISDARTAQQLLHDLPGRHLTFAFVLEVVALASSGRSEDAHRAAETVVGDPRFTDAPFDPLSWSLPYIAWMEGDLDSVERHAARLLTIGEQFGLEGTILAANYFLGTVAYERNQLAEAERRLSNVFDHRYATAAMDATAAAIALASTRIAQGRVGDADETTAALMQFVLETHSEHLQPIADAFLAESGLRRAHTEAGLRWARGAALPTQRYSYMWYNPEAAQIEVLLASPPDVERGRELLHQVLETARTRRHRPLTIRLLGVQALDLADRHDEPGALIALEEAVRLAQPGGIVRRLADLGPRLIPLLQRLDVDGDVLLHAGAILAAAETPHDQPADAPSARSATAGGLGLTEREADVLRLLVARLSNKEIARDLMIAPATVKKHTVTLYNKLNVHSRREAVAKALTLGYIND